MTARRTVALTLNGEARSGEAEPRMLLADFLRDALGLTGTHVGCEHGVCGACTVIVDGQAARSCLMLAVQADGARVLTVEGLATAEGLHPLQSSFARHHGLQCGFCTPGMLMVALELIAATPEPSAEAIREGMSAAICRCTGYDGILKAVAEYAAEHGQAHARRTIEGNP
jgi:aerobic-type carbon monoxide dehydrogenase small subunit (CoxS/CutS family)